MNQATKNVVKSSKARTLRIINAIDEAIKIIEKEIKDNNGIYPYNSGRISLSEVSRRAGVHPITLMGESHKYTTRITIQKWINGLGSNFITGKRAVRQSISTRVISAEDQFKTIAAKFQAMYQVEIPKRDAELEKLRLRVQELEEENLNLQNLISKGRVVRLTSKK